MEDLGHLDIDHETTNFVDDSSNMIAGETVKDLESCLRKSLTLLIHYYRANRLKLNNKKTMIMIMKNNFKKEISIQASNGKIIYNQAQIKVLGIWMNPQNSMTTNIMKARAISLNRLTQLKPILESITSIEQRRLCITSSVISIMRYCCALYHDSVKSKFHTTIMIAYRAIYNIQHTR